MYLGKLLLSSLFLYYIALKFIFIFGGLRPSLWGQCNHWNWKDFLRKALLSLMHDNFQICEFYYRLKILK